MPRVYRWSRRPGRCPRSGAGNWRTATRRGAGPPDGCLADTGLTLTTSRRQGRQSGDGACPAPRPSSTRRRSGRRIRRPERRRRRLLPRAARRGHEHHRGQHLPVAVPATAATLPGASRTTHLAAMCRERPVSSVKVAARYGRSSSVRAAPQGLSGAQSAGVDPQRAGGGRSRGARWRCHTGRRPSTPRRYCSGAGQATDRKERARGAGGLTALPEGTRRPALRARGAR